MDNIFLGKIKTALTEYGYKTVHIDEDVIELIDTCIHSAAKLINTIDHIEKEINNYERTN